jgi:hypothetical protein
MIYTEWRFRIDIESSFAFYISNVIELLISPFWQSHLINTAILGVCI